MNNQKIEVALDIGSVSIKAIALDEKRRIIHRIYYPIKGQLRLSLKNVLQSLNSIFKSEICSIIAITGSSANFYAELLGLNEVNGILATYLGTLTLVPEAGAILEIGGEHAKFIRLSSTINGENILKDFYLNSNCSAGTGSFLEQEAHRLNLSIAEFSRLAGESKQYAHIAGRCAVFAKTDIVHLHQNGVPLPDIAQSLCRAIVQNISNELISKRKFNSPLVFIGGVAENIGIKRALTEILKLDKKSLIVPEDHLFVSAFGSYLFSKRENIKNKCSLKNANKIIGKYQKEAQNECKVFAPLHHPGLNTSNHFFIGKKPIAKPFLNDSIIGIDIGSTSTNLVCINSSGNVIDEITIPTQGKALAAVFKGLSYFQNKFGVFSPKAVGITGSGRKFVGEIIGADLIINEITAHASGGIHFYPQVDTIFDVGGQDSKYIQIENGSVANFEMNKVCSAGTGSFLEEMSELAGLNIKDEFARVAMRSKIPISLGERCTVFMASELMRRLQEGNSREDLVAGLCYSVVKNYLSRVVGRHKIGKYISFQGGVASNPAIISALENLLQKPIFVHRYHEIAGAIGVALLAKNQIKGASKFRGFENLNIKSITTKSFECNKCSNTCAIHFTKDETGNRFFSGGLCDRYEGKNTAQISKKNHDEIDLFAERERALCQHIKQFNSQGKNDCIGIPRALIFYELTPFWSSFFNSLGLCYKFSEPTTKKTIQKGISVCPSNPCLPVKTAYGHCAELLDEGIQKIFIPSISNLCFLTVPERLNHICPAAQSVPFTTRSLFSENINFLTPTIRFAIPHFLKSDIVRFGSLLGFKKQDALRAFENALEAQREFYHSMETRGKFIFSNLHDRKTYAVILSRPYTINDPQVLIRLKKIFKELDIIAIPLDMVPCQPKTSNELDGMYWYYGKRFMQVMDELTNHRRIAVIHLSNFGCGADSFIIHFLRQRQKNTPFLELEIDEHSEFTGISTRLEAFIYSLNTKNIQSVKKTLPSPELLGKPTNDRKLLIPQMSDHAFAFSAAFQSYGVNAKVLPLPDEESILLGKQSVAGGEYLKYHGNELPAPEFFMISGDGPCRLGQYPYLQRMVLDEKGYKDVSIFDASQDQNFYEKFDIVPNSFKRKVWQGVVATDILFRKWRESRPYSKEKKFCDKIYREEIEKICNCIQENGKLSIQLRKAFDRLENDRRDTSEYKPIIAVLGENYVRCNSTANGRIAEVLEAIGAEVWFPSLYEWIYYGNWTARLHCLYEKQYKKFLNLFLTDMIQHLDEYKLTRAIKGRLRNLEEPSIAQNFKFASKYVPETFEGETMIEIARTIDFFKKGASGVIHVVPFGCIMGTIVETLSQQVSQDLLGFPILTIQYDGQDYKSQTSKLEAFMVRARIWNEQRRENANISYH